MAQQFGHKSLETFMMAYCEGLLSSPLKKEVAVGSEVQSSANVTSDDSYSQDLYTPFESVAPSSGSGEKAFCDNHFHELSKVSSTLYVLKYSCPFFSCTSVLQHHKMGGGKRENQLRRAV